MVVVRKRVDEPSSIPSIYIKPLLYADPHSISLLSLSLYPNHRHEQQLSCSWIWSAKKRNTPARQDFRIILFRPLPQRISAAWRAYIFLARTKAGRFARATKQNFRTGIGMSRGLRKEYSNIGINPRYTLKPIRYKIKKKRDSTSRYLSS